MARDRSTPASAQLRRWLAGREGHHATFSALTLAAEFDAPRGQSQKITLATINKALRSTFGDAEIIAYVDERGRVLREVEFGAPGSAALEHPTIFGLPGTPSPCEGYRPATATEVGRESDECDDIELDAPADTTNGVLADAGEGVDAADVVDTGASAGNASDGEGPDESELVDKVAEWRPISPAPQWLDPLLREYVGLPYAHAMWRDWLTKSPSQRARIPLIRAGVRRKGDLTAASVTMLSELCRTSVEWWDRCARAALQSYTESSGRIPTEELPELCADPIGYCERHAHPGAHVVLIGMMVGADVVVGRHARQAKARAQAHPGHGRRAHARAGREGAAQADRARRDRSHR